MRTRAVPPLQKLSYFPHLITSFLFQAYLLFSPFPLALLRQVCTPLLSCFSGRRYKQKFVGQAHGERLRESRRDPKRVERQHARERTMFSLKRAAYF